MDPANNALLIEFDFIKKNQDGEPELDDEGNKQAEPHKMEVGKDQVMSVNWPKPSKYYWMIQESWKHSIEESYFWILNYLRSDLGYAVISKVTDVFTAAEQSAMFGSSQQRLGMQQDKVSSFLAIIGKMTKELFQLVREMRIIDERLSFYIGSDKRDKKVFAVKDTGSASKEWESAEITLKGYWVDLVEQGSKNPASVYGMAREVQFTTLPDLFFSIHPYDETMVDDAVDHPDFVKAFNRKVREVLKRKLQTYLVWKKQTRRELLDKRGFTLRYMYQHVHIIKLYMNYVKPYLKNIQRLQMDEAKAESPDIVAAFENSMIEIEILAQFLPMENTQYWSVYSLHFLFRTKPSMNYHAEGYNRGPIHEGYVEMTHRLYVWTQKQIDNYKKMRNKEDFLLLKVIDKNLEFAMAELGADLFKYLNEMEEMMKTTYKDSGYVPYAQTLGIEDPYAKKKEEKPKAKSSNPFVAVFEGFKDLGQALTGGKGNKDKKKAAAKTPSLNKVQKDNEKKNASSDASQKSWLVYKNYKKGHDMIAW